MFSFIKKTPIDKGWSCDKKYCAVTADGTKYLLRISPEEKAKNREDCFRRQRQVAALGIPMSLPVEYGKCRDGVYIIQSWIDGRDAEDAIPTLPEEEQYAYGISAGRILKEIHSIPAPPGQPDWQTRFNAKIDRKIKAYETCPIKFDGDAAILKYIENNRHLISNRPQSFQHGDYHIGNMMIDTDGTLVIIDFDRFDFGDPWEEFNRIVWCAQASPPFASGITDGYFDGDVPMEFWRLLALYIGSNTLSSLPWAIQFGDKEIRTMLNQTKGVLEWYNNMRNVVPSWYKKLNERDTSHE